ncbi:helix-turn-helix domain-containing protein, partial [Mycobacterium kansasii]
VEVYRITVDTTTQHSPAHATGVRETITVVAGTLEAGPLADPQIAAAGETMCFPGNVAHIYRAVNRPAEAVLTMHYPP